MRQRADGSGTADQRREQMLRAALEVIDERGYPETRIADVAERAGTSPALVIYYFKTKNQLLTEAIRFSEDRWYETGTSRIAAINTAAGRLEEPSVDSGRAFELTMRFVARELGFTWVPRYRADALRSAGNGPVGERAARGQGNGSSAER